MILAELPFFQCAFDCCNNEVIPKRRGHVPLDKLEVVQLFHVSPLSNRDSILGYGLIPKGKTTGLYISYGPRIFVSSTFENVAFDYVACEDVDVWSFYLPKNLLTPDEFSWHPNHYYLTEPVPYYKLNLLESR